MLGEISSYIFLARNVLPCNPYSFARRGVRSPRGWQKRQQRLRVFGLNDGNDSPEIAGLVVEAGFLWYF